MLRDVNMDHVSHVINILAYLLHIECHGSGMSCILYDVTIPNTSKIIASLCALVIGLYYYYQGLRPWTEEYEVIDVGLH
jgi:hypothetical protein